MSQWITPRRNQSNPSAITPDTTRYAPSTDSTNNANANFYDTLIATDKDSLSLSLSLDQADDDSLSTMSNDDNTSLISQATLKSRMEMLEPGITTTNSNPKYTDVVLFQEAMGNAVADLAVFNQPLDSHT